jgi:Co/Zn/Cd efflux system component
MRFKMGECKSIVNKDKNKNNNNHPHHYHQHNNNHHKYQHPHNTKAAKYNNKKKIFAQLILVTKIMYTAIYIHLVIGFLK